MANRLIGVEITPGTVRVAVLGQFRGTATVTALEQRPYRDPDEVPALLGAMVPGGFQMTDRVAAALPAGESYARTLRFPFRERRKILAAAPFELASQLPVALDDCLVATLTPLEDDEGAITTAAAVGRGAIEELLARFDGARVPLHVLDLMPYALAAGAGAMLGTGLLACLTEQEATLSCLQEGRLADYRHFPPGDPESAPAMIDQLLDETALFRPRLGQSQGPLRLTGALATPQLLEQVRSRGMSAELFTLTLGGRTVAPAFVPAAALALRAADRTGEKSFNLRQGRYAYRGEAATLRRLLFGLGGLLAASLLIFAVSTALGYRDRSRQAETLKQQIAQQYRETFPGSQITVDVALQMESKLQELRNRATAFGIGGAPQVLPILKELSILAGQVPYDVDELTCDQGACSLTGQTDSFEAVNRIRDRLGASPRFARAEVAQTRKTADGSRIEFRLRLPLAAGGGQ